MFSNFLLVSFYYKIFIYDVSSLRQVEKIYNTKECPFDIIGKLNDYNNLINTDNNSNFQIAYSAPVEGNGIIICKCKATNKKPL